MGNALFVSVRRLYPMLVPAARVHGNDALRDITCCAWPVNLANATGVRYLLGVAEAQVVSAYEVKVPSAQWPVLPAPSASAGSALRRPAG